MLFFKRILNFTPDAIAKKEKRENTRYPVGPAFPVKAVLLASERDRKGKILKPEVRNSQGWEGLMLNLSSTGVSMQLQPGATVSSGEICEFRLSFEKMRLEIAARVAHFRTYANHSVCGVSLEFQDPEIRKAYLQVLEPVVIGSTFKPVDSKRIKQDTVDLKKEQYQGDSNTRLTVWRVTGGSAIAGFDLQVGSYSVAGSSDSPDLDINGNLGDKAGGEFDAAATGEVRRFFHWIVPNLAKSIPLDIRKFLGRF